MCCKNQVNNLRQFLVSFVLLSAALMFPPAPAMAQTDRADDDQITITGTVSSSSPNALVVREDGGRHRVFVFDRNAARPASIPVGSRVRVVSTPSSERGVRVASSVAVTGSGPAADAQQDPVPEQIRQIERSIERQARRYRMGVRTGVALDPEVLLAGVHAQFATGINRNFVFRPNVEFAWGELTTMFAINLEGIYRFTRQGNWVPYAGLGPGFNFIHQGLQRSDRSVDFSDFDYDGCLNLLGGIENRNGLFFEMKASVYARPAPTLRLIVGYNF